MGTASLTTGCFGAAGPVITKGELNLTDCPAPTSNGGVVQDPYSWVTVPSEPSTCSSYPTAKKGEMAVYSPGLYCKGLDLDLRVHFEPGIYVVEDKGFRINSTAHVTGEGVTFILTNDGEVSFNGSATIQLSAPKTGPFAGVLIYADRDGDPSKDHKVNGNSESYFEGVIYAPSQPIVFNGNNMSMGDRCTHLIGRTIQISGTASFGNDCSEKGTRTIEVPGAIVLVE